MNSKLRPHSAPISRTPVAQDEPLDSSFLSSIRKGYLEINTMVDTMVSTPASISAICSTVELSRSERRISTPRDLMAATSGFDADSGRTPAMNDYLTI